MNMTMRTQLAAQNRHVDRRSIQRATPIPFVVGSDLTAPVRCAVNAAVLACQP